MNILKYKYKAHKLINLIFYFIVFLLGFLLGGGNLKNITNFLFIENVEAYVIDTTNVRTYDEEYILNKFKEAEDYDYYKYPYIVCSYSEYSNQPYNELICYAIDEENYNNISIDEDTSSLIKFSLNFIKGSYYYEFKMYYMKGVNGALYTPNDDANKVHKFLTTSSSWYAQFGQYLPLSSNTLGIFTNFDIKNVSSRGNKAIHVLDFSDALYDRKENEYIYYSKDETGVYSNEIMISSSLSRPVTMICPKNKPFSNKYCYYSYSDVKEEVLKERDTFSLDIDLRFAEDGKGIAIMEKSLEKYYVLTYRVKSNVNILPTNLSISGHYYGSENSVMLPITEIIEKKVHTVGDYKDIQIVYKLPSDLFENSLNENNAEKFIFYYIGVNHESLNTSIVNSDFKYGVYRSYKMKSYDHKPTDSELENNYYSNSIDSIDGTNEKKNDPFSDINSNDFGISGIIKAPINALNKINSGTCNPVSINIKGTEFKLECGGDVFWNKPGVSNFKKIWQILASGLICYGIGRSIVRTINKLKDPTNDKLEVVDL